MISLKRQLWAISRGAGMRSSALMLFCLTALPLAAFAQQSKAGSPAALNDTQILGRRVFQQRCAICHTESTPGANRYGPVLYKELIVGNEGAMRDFIANGSAGKMPGFEYGLEPAEINAIVEYLKTVSRPVKRNTPDAGNVNVMD
jgi:mono/diheme cytochrome c family protein